MARQDPDKATSSRKSAAEPPGDVRAGPGDAGQQDRPERLPERPGGRQKGRNAVMLFAVLCAIGAVVWVILQLAA